MFQAIGTVLAMPRLPCGSRSLTGKKDGGVKQSMQVLCTFVNGKLKLFDRAEFERLSTRFMDGQELVLTIEEEGRQRTSRQNRFFHGPVCKAFRELGWADEDTKTELCLRFLPVEHARPDGTVVLVPGHTSTLGVEEFNRFLDACIQFAAEHDVYIEDSDLWRQKQGRPDAHL